VSASGFSGSIFFMPCELKVNSKFDNLTADIVRQRQENFDGRVVVMHRSTRIHCSQPSPNSLLLAPTLTIELNIAGVYDFDFSLIHSDEVVDDFKLTSSCRADIF